MAKVFLSYRRADSAPFAGRIYDRLVMRFGRKSVFKDVDDIPPAVDIANAIQQSLRECAVALIVIGPHWLDTRDDRGHLRLDHATDFVRVEIETALSLGIAVLPVLVDGATMPPRESLPESLRPLGRLNAVSVRNDPDFTRDMGRVIESLERIFNERTSNLGWFGKRRRPHAEASTSALAIGTPPITVEKRLNQPARSRRRTIVAAFSALLLIAAISILLAAKNPFWAIHVARPTATLTDTQKAAPTLTAAANTRFPYGPVAPGMCDPGFLLWQAAPTETVDFTCTTSGTEVHISKGSLDVIEYYVAQGIVLRPPYTVQITVADVSPRGSVLLVANTRATPNGYFGIEADQLNQQCAAVASGPSSESFVASDFSHPHALAIAVASTSTGSDVAITLACDDRQIMHAIVPQQYMSSIMLRVFGPVGSSATLSKFWIH